MSANLACRLFDLIAWSSARSFNMNLKLLALGQVEQSGVSMNRKKPRKSALQAGFCWYVPPPFRGEKRGNEVERNGREGQHNRRISPS